MRIEYRVRNLRAKFEGDELIVAKTEPQINNEDFEAVYFDKIAELLLRYYFLENCRYWYHSASDMPHNIICDAKKRLDNLRPKKKLTIAEYKQLKEKAERIISETAQFIKENKKE